jgi:hypothetical protein
MQGGAALEYALKIDGRWKHRPIIGWFRTPAGEVVCDDAWGDPWPGGNPVHVTPGPMEPAEGVTGAWEDPSGTARIETIQPGEPEFESIRKARKAAEQSGLLDRMEQAARQMLGT